MSSLHGTTQRGGTLVGESSHAAASPRLIAFEVVWIFLVFFLVAGSPPPDAGESHYLVKAKHYWNPAWCEGDLFLESYDTHLGFYWTLGWLTKFFSLDAAAWILRVVVWLALAQAWQRLSWTIGPRPLFSLLSIGLMLLAADHFHWSKEIVLRGGVEGKTVAYVAVLHALTALARNRWGAALLWAGAGGAFHVLVGGWAVIGLAIAWLLAGSKRPSAWSLILPAAAGFLCALPGLLPALALMQSSSGQDSAEAARIYVFERLAHHLVWHSFPHVYHVRHAALAILWGGMAWRYRTIPEMARVNQFVAGAIVIALVGIALDQFFVIRANVLLQNAAEYERSAAVWLRYYWFRLEDAVLPVGFGLTAVLAIARLRARSPLIGEWVTAAAILAGALNVGNACYWRARLRVPGAVLQQLATEDTRLHWWWEQTPSAEAAAVTGEGSELLRLTARERNTWWLLACQWIDTNTPPTARVLTPRRQQTFKWHANRPEVATRKDIPQDPAGILVWHAALHEIYPNDLAHRRFDLAAFGDEELVHLARKYSCQYILVERRWQARQIGLPRVYPKRRGENPVFEVYRVPPPRGAAREAAR